MNTPTPHNNHHNPRNPHQSRPGETTRPAPPNAAATAAAAPVAAPVATGTHAPIVGGRYVGSPAFWVTLSVGVVLGLYLFVSFDYSPGFVFPTRPLTLLTLMIAAGSIYAHLARRWRVAGLVLGGAMMALAQGLYVWLGFEDLSLGIDDPTAAAEAYYSGVEALQANHPFAFGVFELLQETIEVWWALAIAAVPALVLRSIATPPPLQFPNALQRVGEKFFTRPTTLATTIVFGVAALLTSIQAAGLGGMMIIHPALAGAFGGVVIASLISRSRLITFATVGMLGLVPMIAQAVVMYPMSPEDPVIYPPVILEPVFQALFFAGLLGVSALLIRRRSSQPDPFAPTAADGVGHDAAAGHGTADAVGANGFAPAAPAAPPAPGPSAAAPTNATARDFLRSQALMPVVVTSVLMALTIFIGVLLQVMFIPWPLLPPVSAVVLFFGAWWLWRAPVKTLRTTIIATIAYWVVLGAARAVWYLNSDAFLARQVGLDMALEVVFHLTQGLLFAAIVVLWARMNRPETSALEGSNTSGAPVGHDHQHDQHHQPR